MEHIFEQLFSNMGSPAISMAMLLVLIKMNNTLTIQKDGTLKLIHELDKRVTVIESKGGK